MTVREDAVKYLDGLAWDGEVRIVPALLGVGVTAGGEAIRDFMARAVARAYEPGCACDKVLVLSGAEGTGKTSFFRALVPRPTWMFQVYGVHHDPRVDAWVVVLYGKLPRRGDDLLGVQLKAYVATTVDKYRPLYARETVSVPRSHVLAITTNAEVDFGESRYDVVHVDRRFLALAEALPTVRDQWWAEAKAVYERERAGRIHAVYATSPEVRS